MTRAERERGAVIVVAAAFCSPFKHNMAFPWSGARCRGCEGRPSFRHSKQPVLVGITRFRPVGLPIAQLRSVALFVLCQACMLITFRRMRPGRSSLLDPHPAMRTEALWRRDLNLSVLISLCGQLACSCSGLL